MKRPGTVTRGHCPGHLAGRTDSPGPELTDTEPAPEGERGEVDTTPITGPRAVAAAQASHPAEASPFPPPRTAMKETSTEQRVKGEASLFPLSMNRTHLC